MELLFIWLKQANSLKNIGLNFGGAYRFTYSEENQTLLIDKDLDYIEDFFGKDILNISVLVGSNGSGKSTIIEYLIDNLPDGQNQQPYGIVAHFDQQEENLIIYLHPDIARKITIHSNNVRYWKVDNLKYQYTEVIYFTNSLYDRVVDTKVHGLLNMSLKSQLFKPDEKARTGDEFLLRFKFEEYRKILSYLAYNQNHNLSINLPKYLVLSALFITEINFDQQYLEKSNREKYQEIYNAIVDHYNLNLTKKLSDKEKFLNIVERNIVLDELATFNLLEINSELIRKILENPIDLPRVIYKESPKPKEIREFINYLDQLIDEDKVSSNQNIAWVELKKFDESGIANLLQKIRHLSHYNSNFLQLGLSHSLMQLGESSSGELALLSIISRLYALSRGEQVFANLEIENRALILMDEPELYLHPLWQKNVVNYLVELVPLMFPKVKLQFILTSHSPFVISDLPKNKICFLNLGATSNSSELLGHKQTFASNIHTLLSDSFFMDNGFMGEFAKRKLDNIIEDLNTTKQISNSRKDEIKKVIMLIGEPIIKRKLLEMFTNKFNLDIDDRLTNIEKRLGI